MKLKESRTILVGDIHGCLEELDELLIKIEYNSSDKLILLGDLVDRGPDSVGVVRRAQELNAISLMGNHEQKYIKWFKSNRKIYDHLAYYDKFNDADINYLHKMPLYLEVTPDLIAVHAGLKSGIPLKDQKLDDCCYLRFMDKNWAHISIRKIMRDKPEGAMFWTSLWTGPHSVIYGHHVHSYDAPKIEEVAPNIKCYGMDTGCCFGGKLSAFILETSEIVQVQAKEVYYKSEFADLEI